MGPVGRDCGHGREGLDADDVLKGRFVAGLVMGCEVFGQST